jgi:hypothetical protein
VDRGIVAAEVGPKLTKGLKLKRGQKPLVISPTAADDLLEGLKRLCNTPGDVRIPQLNLILEAERLFDAHTSYYDHGEEDVTPLALEWYAAYPQVNYTCRYDMIGRLGPMDPLVRTRQFEAGAIVAYEAKTAAWLSENVLEGWDLDGEILGEFLCWEPSGCADRFGDLAAVVIDVVTKGKTPKCQRLILPPERHAAVTAYIESLRYEQAQIALWRAAHFYPRRVSNCIDRWGKCSEWDRCARSSPL